MIVRSHLDALLNLVFTFEVYQTTGSSLLYRRAYHNERISHFIDTGAISDKRFEELRVHQ